MSTRKMQTKIRKSILFALIVIMVILASGTGFMAMGTGSIYAASSTQPYIRYVVQWGDSLYKISKVYGSTINSIKAANNLQSDLILAGQTLKVPMTANKPLKDIISAKGLSAGQLQLRLVVDKSDKLLTVYNGNTPLKAYHVELGDGGTGDKQIAGDHKTPEGSFYITQRLVLDPADEYLGSRWMRLSYPNIEDAKRGLETGLINKATYNAIVSAINKGQTPPQDTALGGGIGIHGGSTSSFGTNWTWGCVGLTNKDVQDFYNYMYVGTKVVIQK